MKDALNRASTNISVIPKETM